ncbi:MAG TPA: IclR family transcriptional regulator [Solirubrobacteraceae bacterium]|jgi:DNA-binding IclR family transcriptional regulator
MGAESKRVLVLEKAWQILSLFSVETPEHDMREIRSATGLPATTCSRIVRSLTGAGLLVQSDDSFRIGLAVVAWADAALAGLDVLDAVRPVLSALRDETGETAGFFVRHGQHRVCLAFAESQHPLGRRLSLGHLLPLNVGAPGRVLLAFDEQAVQEMRTSPLPKFTDATIDTWPELETVLAKVRRDGYSHSNGEWSLELAGLAVPVMADERGLLGAIALSTPVSRLPRSRVGSMLNALKQSANDVTRALSGRDAASAR